MLSYIDIWSLPTGSYQWNFHVFSSFIFWYEYSTQPYGMVTGKCFKFWLLDLDIFDSLKYDHCKWENSFKNVGKDMWEKKQWTVLREILLFEKSELFFVMLFFWKHCRSMQMAVNRLCLMPQKTSFHWMIAYRFVDFPYSQRVVRLENVRKYWKSSYMYFLNNMKRSESKYIHVQRSPISYVTCNWRIK